jgi:hypothetical protein
LYSSFYIYNSSLKNIILKKNRKMVWRLEAAARQHRTRRPTGTSPLRTGDVLAVVPVPFRLAAP